MNRLHSSMIALTLFWRHILILHRYVKRSPFVYMSMDYTVHPKNDKVAVKSFIKCDIDNDDYDDHYIEDNSANSSLSSSFNNDNYIKVPHVNLSVCSDRYFSSYLDKKCIEKFKWI